MGVLTIRRLDDGVIARLKARAKLNGRSMEEEARIAITGLVREPPRGQAAVDHFKALRERTSAGRVMPDSTMLFREMREGDPLAWDGE